MKVGNDAPIVETLLMARRGSTLETTLHSVSQSLARPRLLLVVGAGHFGTYPLLPGKTLVIGRDPDSDVPLAHPKISRRHAHVHTGDVIEVEDLGSTNGTRLAGRRLAAGERTPLDRGKNLQLGPFVAVVLDASHASERQGPLRAAIPVSDPTPGGVPEVVARVARGTVSVLITGETGAGKEILARTLHELSGRTGQLVAINCASLSEPLLESELFGHERGAFTGAAAAKPGLFEVAAGGTVFLDEVGELPAGLQARLLRVLETQSAYRVGGVKPVSLDVRFIAATHRHLADEVAAGRFREDLYFRVNGIVLLVQPLRERRDVIPALAATFLARAMPPGKAPPRIGATALEALLRHPWPGNVRELRTVMERAAVVCEGPELGASHILLDEPGGRPPPVPPARREAAVPAAGDGDDEERQRLIDALAACAGNQTQAARVLGISRTTMVNMLAVHRIPRPRKPSR